MSNEELSRRLQDIAILDRAIVSQLETCALCGKKIDPLMDDFAVLHTYAKDKIAILLMCKKCCQIKQRLDLNSNYS